MSQLIAFRSRLTHPGCFVPLWVELEYIGFDLMFVDLLIPFSCIIIDETGQDLHMCCLLIFIWAAE